VTLDSLKKSLAPALEAARPARDIARAFVGYEPGRPPRVSLEKWFLGWLDRQNNFAKNFSPRNVYFEFGTGTGKSMRAYARAVRSYREASNAPAEDFRIVAFDTFEGLPATDDPRDVHVEWEAGKFARTEQQIGAILEEEGFDLRQVRFVKGLFEQSLTEGLRDELMKAGLRPAIVNVDVDYYTSTQQALDWMQPLLQSGAAFYFDDIWSFHGHPDKGQIRAIREFNASGRGHLCPCDLMGLDSQTFLYSAPEWEWT